jgi:dehydrogenase/reductase SDR family member 7B
MEIRGRTVWITGASSGIGEALAEALFRLGATVILSARNMDKLSEIKYRLDSIEKERCHVLACDVTMPSSIENALNQVKQLVEKLDLLINNAGVSQRSYALDTTVEVDRKIMEVNFFGAVTITKGVLPWMIGSGGGHIVVISSMAGKYGFRMRTAYAASKHALHGFFETLRAEVHDKKINITMICPGRVQTDISYNSLTGNGRLYGKMDKGQEKGISLDKCVRVIIRAIKHNRKEVFIGGPELFLLEVKRICPPLYYWIANHASPT